MSNSLLKRTFICIGHKAEPVFQKQ